MGASKATLLNMFNIVPFFWGLIIQQVFNNNDIYNSKVLYINNLSLHSHFLEGTHKCCQCLYEYYETVVSVPHSIIIGHSES